MTCDQIADRIIDHLYGELAEGERPTFEAHLAGCEGCRGKVAALDQTRRSAQVALRGPLSQPAPERIRRAAMAAAELHVRQRAPAMKAVAVDARSVDGFWAWLRRPWFLPAFVTVSALALFFITRPMLMDGPRRALESHMSEPVPVAAPAPEPQAVPALAAKAESAAEPPAQSPPVAGEKARDRATGLERAGGALDDGVRARKIADLRAESVYRAGPPPSRRLAAAPEKKMVAKRKSAMDLELAPELAAAKEEEAREQPLAEAVGAGAGARAEPKGASYLMEGARPSAVTRSDSAPREQKPTAAPTEMKRSAPADKPATRFAQPPPGVRQVARPFASGGGAPSAPAAVPFPASTPPPASASAPPPAPTSARAPAPPPAAARERAAAAPDRAPASASADEADAPTANAAGRGATSPSLSLDALIEKADRHFRNQQWQAASDAYRELLRRFPRHEWVNLWRQRRDISMRAITR